jgi:hypothetical protein
MTDWLIRITSVAAVTVSTATISYRHANEMMSTHGDTGLTARLVPFMVDGHPGGQHTDPERQPTPASGASADLG